jgi:hypothetical protein
VGQFLVAAVMAGASIGEPLCFHLRRMVMVDGQFAAIPRRV